MVPFLPSIDLNMLEYLPVPNFSINLGYVVLRSISGTSYDSPFLEHTVLRTSSPMSLPVVNFPPATEIRSLFCVDCKILKSLVDVRAFPEESSTRGLDE